jgi:phage I-like protein
MPDQPATPAAVQPPAPSAIPDAPAEHMIPKSRLDDVLAKLDAAQKKADALEKAQQDADRKRLEEANEYKKLYETTQTELSSLKPKAEQVDAYEKTLTEILEAQVAELPDEFKDVVPDGLSTKQKLDWLAKNKSKFMKAEPFDIGAGKRGTRAPEGVKLTDEEMQAAKHFGMSPEEYAKFK